MPSRRDFLLTTGAALAAGKAASARSLKTPDPASDPWLEVSPAALRHNAETLSRRSGGRRILAVAKNNAYGLGLETVGPLLDGLAPVWGLAVVRPSEALALRRAGVKKPVLLMGPASDEEAELLARRGVRLACSTTADTERVIRLSRKLKRPIAVHLYVDTGMHRMGFPYQALLPLLGNAALRRAIRIEGAFSELVEDQEYDREQAARLTRVAADARAAGVPLGLLHCASSDAVMRPTAETFLDLLRPGLSLYGGYPTAESQARGELLPAYRLKARVIRVERLEAGEGVSYHRRYQVQAPTWTATLAVGHVDGYPAGAVKGCEVLIGERLYPVVGTVSASHTIVALGPEPAAKLGDQAILVGPDRPSLHPNVVAERAGWSEYNMFMHLNPDLARKVV